MQLLSFNTFNNLNLQGIIILEFAHMYLSVTTSLSHNFVGVHLDENERKAGKRRIKEDSLLYKQVLYP